MMSGTTFRQSIENNKAKIMKFLAAAKSGKKHTSDICHGYGGEKEMPAVRKALNELRKEGKIETDDKVHMWQGKLWWIIESKNEVSQIDVDELMKLRIKLIAGWPGCQWGVGTVFPINFIDEAEAAEHPHLFRILGWWEERKPEEMPKYVRESEGTEHGSIVYFHKVTEHFTHGGGCCLCDAGGGNIHYCYLQPATETEYLDYVKETEYLDYVKKKK
jgi:hypothetical protein